MDPETLEGFVDADEAGKFLSTSIGVGIPRACASTKVARVILSATWRGACWRFPPERTLLPPFSSTEKSGFASRQKSPYGSAKAVPGAIGMGRLKCRNGAG